MQSIKSISLISPPLWKTFNENELENELFGNIPLNEVITKWGDKEYSERKILVNGETFFVIHDRGQSVSYIFDDNKKFIDTDGSIGYINDSISYKLISIWTGNSEPEYGLEEEDYGQNPYGNTEEELQNFLEDYNESEYISEEEIEIIDVNLTLLFGEEISQSGTELPDEELD